MVIGLLRVKKCKLRTSKALLPVPAIISACQFRIFSSMREGNVISTASGTEENIRLPPIKVHFTPEIEKKYVHRVYDAIAPHFSSTRFAKWPKVATFLKSLPSGSVVLDAGCGNGKYLGLHPECYFIGCDISASLIKICSDKDHEVLVADAVNLPYRTGFGDAAISIAVLHHLSTEQRRKKAIEELVRVVKKGGLVLITVWAMEQEDKNLLTKWTPLVDKYVDEWVGPGSPRVRISPSQTLESISEADGNTVKGSKFDFAEYVDEWVGPSSPRVRSSPSQTLESISEADGNPVKGSKFDFAEKSNEIVDLAFDSMDSEDKDSDQQEYFVPWHLPYHRAEVGGSSASALESGLAKKDDKKGAVVYNRYYHVFNEGELERLVSGMDNVSVVDRFFDKSNWCIVLEKTC